MTEGTILIACRAVQAEIERSLRGRAQPTAFLDPDLHFDYAALEEALLVKLEESAREGRSIVLVYGECFPGIDALAARYGAARVRATNCLSMLLGEERYVDGLARGAFYMMPQWLSSWREVFEQRFGLDDALTRELLSEVATSVVCVGTEARSPRKEDAEELARHVGLPLEHVCVGLDHLRDLIDEALPRARRHLTVV